ncbi:heme-binding protein [Streptomyces xiangluensis]|uniref:Heme-binding protein n=1 Tax=Streptomyces xiangluensis TaxID=2665720 RepID=A0ABV8YQP3_9ACTN
MISWPGYRPGCRICWVILPSAAGTRSITWRPPDRTSAAAPARASNLLPVAGGVPIVTADGEIIGAIGVGGADDVTDDRIAHEARDSAAKIVA